MKQLNSKSNSANDSSRCRHYTVDGRQCRLRVLDTRSGFCFRHAKPQPAHSDADDLSAELLPELSEFQSAVDVNQFLARLLIQVTKGRVTPRRAAVLAYITNQLLHSHRSINQEHALELELDPPRLDLTGMPRPGDDGRRFIVDVPRPPRDNYETSDTMAMIRKLHLAPPNATQRDDVPGEKRS